MTAARLSRPAPRRQARDVVPPEPSASYHPGHFTALVRLHNWPPDWRPQLQRTREVECSEFSRINREKQVALGNTGTIVGLSVKSTVDRLLRNAVSKAVR